MSVTLLLLLLGFAIGVAFGQWAGVKYERYKVHIAVGKIIALSKQTDRRKAKGDHDGNCN